MTANWQGLKRALPTATLCALLSIGATWVGAAIGAGWDSNPVTISDTVGAMRSPMETLWWTLTGLNAGLMVLTAFRSQRSAASMRESSTAALTGSALIITAGLWGFLAATHS